MIQLITGTLISIVVSLGIYNYVPLSLLDKINFKKPTFGTTITTINGSDTLSASRTVLNNNFTALNNGKIEVGSTSINAITTLSNLATVGTITSGTWTGSVIDVARQGTGSTSPTSNQVMLGNGASGFKVIGFGSSGQFLTSGGDATAPSWTTAAIDQTANYNWTGTHLFKNLNASSTVANPLVLNGVSYAFPSAIGASSTVLSVNSTGALVWTNPIASTTATSTTAALPTNQGDTVTKSVQCVSPKRVTGGGYSGLSAVSSLGANWHHPVQNYPSAVDTWTVAVACTVVANSGGTCSAGTLTVYAMCSNP